jgi:hypothetical protein
VPRVRWKVEGGIGGRFVRSDLPEPSLQEGHHCREETYHIVSREAESAAAGMEELAKRMARFRYLLWS